MDKVLKALVVILLVLSITALALGTKLFGQRERLKGRAQKLETAIMALGAAIEQGSATLDREPDYPDRDISDCTEEVIADPEMSDFWSKYAPVLEVQENLPLQLKDRSVQLMTYYRIDPITQKVQIDPMGNKVISGEGTMQEVLDDLLAKAGDQYARLNKTANSLPISAPNLSIRSRSLTPARPPYAWRSRPARSCAMLSTR